MAAAVSSAAGIELVQAWDYEIANVYIAVNDSNDTSGQGKKGSSEVETSTFAWHFDSFLFVCVTMVSNCKDMICSKTAIRTPSGEIRKMLGLAGVSVL